MQRPLLLGLITAVLAALVLGSIVFGSGGIPCKEWQREYAQAAQKERGGILAFINKGPLPKRLRDLKNQRPDNCSIP